MFGPEKVLLCVMCDNSIYLVIEVRTPLEHITSSK